MALEAAETRIHTLPDRLLLMALSSSAPSIEMEAPSPHLFAFQANTVA
jgi:hypothetical protein